MSFIPETVSLERVAQLLGVDELQVVRNALDPDMIVRVRLGARWLATSIDYTSVRTADVGRILYDLATDLKRSMGVDTARGEELDRMASLVGVTREPEPRRPMTRFEAIAEELKKL